MKKQTFILRDEAIRANLMAAIAMLGTDNPVQVTIEPYRKKRSLSQNAYLHACLQIIADETGNSIDDVKDAYRAMFLGKVSVTIGSEECLVGQSTARLDTQEFNDFLEKIRAHAATELGITLPVPEERMAA